MEELYGRDGSEEMAGHYNEVDSFYRKTIKNGTERANSNGSVFEYSKQGEEVFGLGKDEDSGQQTRIDTRRSNAHSDNDSKGVRTFELTSDPNARKSKDDTIYDSPEIENLFDDYEDSGIPDEVDPRDPYGRTTGQMIDDENFELNALLDKALTDIKVKG